MLIGGFGQAYEQNDKQELGRLNTRQKKMIFCLKELWQHQVLWPFKMEKKKLDLVGIISPFQALHNMSATAHFLYLL